MSFRHTALIAIALAALGAATPAEGADQPITANTTVEGRLEQGDTRRDGKFVDTYVSGVEERCARYWRHDDRHRDVRSSRCRRRAGRSVPEGRLRNVRAGGAFPADACRQHPHQFTVRDSARARRSSRSTESDRCHVPYVWVMDRDAPTEAKPAKRRAPKNIFSEPDMYTIKPPTIRVSAISALRTCFRRSKMGSA